MSDFISKKELYHKLGEAYNKGYLAWGANEIIKDILGVCDSVENKGEFDGMTNGEVIQALFPNISVYEHGSTYSVNNEYNFNSTWWNAPYKAEKGGE